MLIPYPGIQNDEALFACGLFEPVVVEDKVSIFKYVIPTMLMSYIGAVKIWLYAIVFSFWDPSVYSLRVPPLLIGAAAIGLTYVLMRRTMGVAAAIAGIALLATDPSYLMTAVFDWGPVAIQHLYGRKVGYPTGSAGQQELFNWLRQSPHRLNLGEGLSPVL